MNNGIEKNINATQSVNMRTAPIRLATTRK